MALKKTASKNYTLNFEKDSFVTQSMMPNGNVLEVGPFYASYSINMPIENYSPTFIQRIDSSLYLWKSNDYVYKTKFSSLEWTSKNIYSSMPKVIRVKDLGKEVDLIFNSSLAEIVGQGVVTLRGKRYTLCEVFNDTFFTSDGKDLYFSNKFTDGTVSDNLFACNFIKIDDIYGKVLFLHGYNKTLYLVCEKAVLTLNVGESLSDYKFTNVVDEGFTIQERSICADGKCVYFISGNFLYCYDGKKLTQKKFFPQGETMLYRGKASIVDGYYLCSGQLKPLGLSCGWYYDLLTDKKGMVEIMDAYADNGGHAYSKEKNIIRRFVRKTTIEYAKCLFQSKALNFGSNLIKRLSLIEFSSEEKLILTVSGNFGSEDFTIEGFTQIKCNLISRTFTFSFNCEGKCLPLKDLKLKYNVLGE